VITTTYEGEPIYDQGLPAYVVVQFANGLRHAIDARGLGKSWQRTSLRQEEA